MLINSLLLAISSSIDSLGIGITYGIKNTKISYAGKVVLFLISLIISILSIWSGNVIKNIFSDFLLLFIGNIILICMGIFICFQTLKKEKNKINNHFSFHDTNQEKIYSFFIKFLGITIQIIKNPSYSDFDSSNSIDAKEALFLGIALSLDSFCIGIGGSVIGINSILFPLFIASFQFIFLNIGNFLGRKLNKLSILPDNIWSIISGILLIIIGISKLFNI